MSSNEWKRLYLLGDGEQEYALLVDPKDTDLVARIMIEPPKHYFLLEKEHKFVPDANSFYDVKTRETVFNSVSIRRESDGYIMRSSGFRLPLNDSDLIRRIT